MARGTRQYRGAIPLLPQDGKQDRSPMESGPPSEIHFTYAESLDDVIRRFRSASYYDVFVDQAEQFSEAELREMKQCVRWAGAPDRDSDLEQPFLSSLPSS